MKTLSYSKVKIYPQSLQGFQQVMDIEYGSTEEESFAWQPMSKGSITSIGLAHVYGNLRLNEKYLVPLVDIVAYEFCT